MRTWARRPKQSFRRAEGVKEDGQSGGTSPSARCPARFDDNVPPNFSPMKVRHEGCLHPACFIKYRMYDDLMVWGTMGEGHLVYQQPAHVAPRLRPNEAEPYSHADTFILLSKYPGVQWVNTTLIDEEDRGL